LFVFLKEIEDKKLEINNDLPIIALFMISLFLYYNVLNINSILIFIELVLKVFYFILDIGLIK